MIELVEPSLVTSHTCSISSLNASMYPHAPTELDPPTGIKYGNEPSDLHTKCCDTINSNFTTIDQVPQFFHVFLHLVFETWCLFAINDAPLVGQWRDKEDLSTSQTVQENITTAVHSIRILEWRFTHTNTHTYTHTLTMSLPYHLSTR